MVLVLDSGLSSTASTGDEIICSGFLTSIGFFCLEEDFFWEGAGGFLGDVFRFFSTFSPGKLSDRVA